MPYILIICVLLVLPWTTHAILPPELIVSVGSNLFSILGIFVVAVVTTYSVSMMLVRQGYMVVRRHILLVLLIINLVAASLVYMYIAKQEAYMSSLQSELESIKNATTTSLCQDGETNCVDGREFYGEKYTIMSEQVLLELDANRIETSSGSGIFNHYTFLHGSIDGVVVDDYATILATTSKPVPHEFVQKHDIHTAVDGSPRNEYDLVLEVGGEIVTVSISDIEGDFITRDELYYTRVHSVGSALVTHRGATSVAHVLVEKTYSSAADLGIFFPGFESTDATTAQFMLWDSEKNFYLFDKTEVHTPSIYYGSHTWLLYKAASGQLEKSFAGVYEMTTAGYEMQWKIAMPDFNQANFTLTGSRVYKTQEGRLRAEVIGTIADTSGERSVRGVAYIVN